MDLKSKDLNQELKLYTISGESYAKTEDLKHRIYDYKLVEKLSCVENGNQPFVKALADNLKFIYAKGAMNYFQLQILTHNVIQSLSTRKNSQDFIKFGYKNQEYEAQSQVQTESVILRCFDQIREDFSKNESQHGYQKQLVIDLIEQVIRQEHGFKIKNQMKTGIIINY